LCKHMFEHKSKYRYVSDTPLHVLPKLLVFNLWFAKVSSMGRRVKVDDYNVVC